MSERSGDLTPGDPLGGPSPEPAERPDVSAAPFGPTFSEPTPEPEPVVPPPSPGPPAAPPEAPAPVSSEPTARPPEAAPDAPVAQPGAAPEAPAPPPGAAPEVPAAPPGAAPEAPAPPPAAAPVRSSGGLWSGDPLAGAAPGGAPAPAQGYTSPPPPGAGGLTPPTGAQPLGGQYVLAGWGSRVLAQLIDGLIIGAGAIALFIAFGALFSIGFSAGDEVGVVSLIVALLLWTVCVAIIALLYAPTLMARTNGQTWGRQAMNIRVVRTSGQPVTFGFAVLREVVVKALLVGFAAGITFGLAYFVDVLWPLWDEENRALHDFPLQTRTVKA